MTSTAVAQMVCAPRTEIVNRLTKKYEEKQIAMGLDSEARLIEIFISNSGSFTILISYVNGLSCVAMAGENWQTTGSNIKR
jgi:hypothetical protein